VYCFTGAANDGDNVNNDGTTHVDGCTNDSFTYVAFDRPSQGQTFTTGSSASGYAITAVWVQHVGYTANTASEGCSNGTWVNAVPGATIELRITPSPVHP
jgi:hypothetical protein